MKKMFLYSPLIFIAIILITCSQTSEPEQNNFKHPRDMTWAADTLKVDNSTAIQVLPQEMLVVSPDDVWLSVWVGHAQLWHYDGTNWEIKKDIGGGIGGMATRGGNEIWAGGYTGDFVLLAQYNGSSWSTYKMTGASHQLVIGYNENNIKGGILDMCVDPDNNIWACGRKGIVLKYDGNIWLVDTIRISNYLIDDYFLKSIEYYNNKIYIIATMYNQELQKEAYFQINGNMNNWVVTDSMIITIESGYIDWGNQELYLNQLEILYSYGDGGVWVYKFKEWNNLLELPYTIRALYGASENYLIAAGGFQKALFYDGSSWEELNDILNIEDPYFSFSVAWTDGHEIFIGGYTFEGYPQRGIIWHSK